MRVRNDKRKTTISVFLELDLIFSVSNDHAKSNIKYMKQYHIKSKNVIIPIIIVNRYLGSGPRDTSDR